jgi:hypothetical protein
MPCGAPACGPSSTPSTPLARPHKKSY